MFNKVMRESKRYITVFFYLILLLFMVGCEHDVSTMGQENEEEVLKEKVQIEIFARAKSYSLPPTRALESEVGKTPWYWSLRDRDRSHLYRMLYRLLKDKQAICVIDWTACW